MRATFFLTLFFYTTSSIARAPAIVNTTLRGELQFLIRKSKVLREELVDSKKEVTTVEDAVSNTQSAVEKAPLKKMVEEKKMGRKRSR